MADRRPRKTSFCALHLLINVEGWIEKVRITQCNVDRQPWFARHHDLCPELRQDRWPVEAKAVPSFNRSIWLESFW